LSATAAAAAARRVKKVGGGGGGAARPAQNASRRATVGRSMLLAVTSRAVQGSWRV